MTCLRRKRKLPPQKPRWELNGYKKKAVCERCGFRARFSAQLRVMHIDSNMNNAAIRNLKTICLNCQIDVDKANLIWRSGDLEPDL